MCSVSMIGSSKTRVLLKNTKRNRQNSFLETQMEQGLAETAIMILVFSSELLNIMLTDVAS